MWQHDDETEYAYEWGGIFATQYASYTWIAQKVCDGRVRFEPRPMSTCVAIRRVVERWRITLGGRSVARTRTRV